MGQCSAVSRSALARRGWPLQEAKELDREREHERGVPLGGDLDDGLKQPQLQRRRMLGHDFGGLRELLGGLQLAVGGDDACASFTFGLRLPRHRPLHGVGQRDVLDLDTFDVDAPARGRAVDHQLHALVELLSIAQQVVEVALADDGPERGLRDLPDGGDVVLHVDRRTDGSITLK